EDISNCRYVTEAATGEAQHQGTGQVAEDMAQVMDEQAVKGFQVVRLHSLHLFKQIRMATHGTLPEDHQRAGQDIGTFHGDRHRDALVREGQEVARTELDGSTGHDVHAVVDHAAHDLGCMVFGHG